MNFLTHSTLGMLAGAGILLGGAGLAQADQTAPETQPFGLQQTTSQGTDFLPNEILTFAGFNTALGTLTGVAITLATSGETNGSVGITMTGGEGIGQIIDSAWIGRQTNLSATGPAGVSFAGAMSGFASCSANGDGFCNASAAMGVSTSQDGTQSVISPNLAPFMLSSFDINLAMSGFFDNSADSLNCSVTNVGGRSPSCTGSANAVWLGELTVVYSYDVATPEPASIALLAGGLGVLGMIRRRRG